MGTKTFLLREVPQLTPPRPPRIPFIFGQWKDALISQDMVDE